jgi:hypothetical protein
MSRTSFLAIFISLFFTLNFTKVAVAQQQNGRRSDNVPKMARKSVARTITILMPDDFRTMTDQELAAKYFTYRKPLAMFTNQDQTVDFGFNVSATRWSYDDLELLQKFYKSTIQNLYTNITMLQEGIKEIDKKKYIVFEFVSEVNADKNNPIQQSKRAYTYLLYTIVEEEVYIFNFTTPASIRNYWSPIAGQMMKSLKL